MRIFIDLLQAIALILAIALLSKSFAALEMAGNNLQEASRSVQEASEGVDRLILWAEAIARQQRSREMLEYALRTKGRRP